MLRDQVLFSQVISWDPHYCLHIPWNTVVGPEQWCAVRSSLQSHSQELGAPTKRRFVWEQLYMDLIYQFNSWDLCKALYFIVNEFITNI